MSFYFTYYHTLYGRNTLKFDKNNSVKQNIIDKYIISFVTYYKHFLKKHIN